MYKRLIATLLLCVTPHFPAHAEELLLSASLEQVSLDAQGDQETRGGQTTLVPYLKLTLEGALPGIERATPLNLALVIDISERDKPAASEELRAAIQAAIDGLDDHDIFSLITYHDTVEVLIPATSIQALRQQPPPLKNLQFGRGSALFAGLVKGAVELRKSSEIGRLNRIILLSASPASVGPANVTELRELSAAFNQEGISITTLGLGLNYDEDLLSAIAESSGGKHLFISPSANTLETFRVGIASLKTVIAKQIEIDIQLSELAIPKNILSLSPIRSQGRERHVRAFLPAFYDGQTVELFVELELNPYEHQSRLLAEIALKYHKTATGTAALDARRLSIGVGDNHLSGDSETIARALRIQAFRALSLDVIRHADVGQFDKAHDLLTESLGSVLERARTDQLSPEEISRIPCIQLVQKHDDDWRLCRKELISRWHRSSSLSPAARF